MEVMEGRLKVSSFQEHYWSFQVLFQDDAMTDLVA